MILKRIAIAAGLVFVLGAIFVPILMTGPACKPKDERSRTQLRLPWKPGHCHLVGQENNTRATQQDALDAAGTS